MLVDKLYRFAIDRLNGRFVSGWCFHRLRKRRPVRLRITVDGTELGSVLCHEYRPDLQRIGLHPTGCCGFDCSLPEGFDPDRHQHLRIFVDAQSRPLISFSCRELDLLRPVVSKPIFFMHIPKTAGSSFNAFARQCFSAPRFATHVERLAPEEQRRLTESVLFLSGHLPWREATRFLSPDHWVFLALLREPLAHLHSHLNYVRRVVVEEVLETHYRFRHNSTIKELSQTLGGVDFTDENQVRSFVAGLCGHQRDFFDNIQTRYFLDYRPERVTDADVDQALDNLQRFHRIGLTEDYDQFRDRFCDDLALPPQPQSIQANRAQRYRLYDPEQVATRELLDPLIRFDLKLYAHVAEGQAAADRRPASLTEGKEAARAAQTNGDREPFEP